MNAGGTASQPVLLSLFGDPTPLVHMATTNQQITLSVGVGLGADPQLQHRVGEVEVQSKEMDA